MIVGTTIAPGAGRADELQGEVKQYGKKDDARWRNYAGGGAWRVFCSIAGERHENA
jgi:hypothetical protein